MEELEEPEESPEMSLQAVERRALLVAREFVSSVIGNARF